MPGILKTSHLPGLAQGVQPEVCSEHVQQRSSHQRGRSNERSGDSMDAEEQISCPERIEGVNLWLPKNPGPQTHRVLMGFEGPDPCHGEPKDS